MSNDNFSISEVMFMLDIIKQDKIEWLKKGTDEDVTNEYNSIISKLESRIEEHNGYSRALNHLFNLKSHEQR